VSEQKPKAPEGEVSVVDLLSAALAQADDKSQVKDITEKLSKLGADGVRELFKTDAFQAVLAQIGQSKAEQADLPPGSEVVVRQGDFSYRHKVHWTRGHIEALYPRVTQVAWRSDVVMPFGVPYRVVQGTEYTLPSIVWDLMRQGDQVGREAQVWAARHFGTPDKIGAAGYYGQIDYGRGFAPEADDLTFDQIDQATQPAAT
jgi:hypothetical protein